MNMSYRKKIKAMKQQSFMYQYDHDSIIYKNTPKQQFFTSVREHLCKV